MNDSVVSVASTYEVEKDRVPIIVRNMAGQDVLVMSAKKTAIFWDVRFHVSTHLNLIPEEVKLMLNYEQPSFLDRIGDLQNKDEDILFHLLVNKIEPIPHWYFQCPNCDRHCNISECVEWSEDPSERCRHPDPTIHMCCYRQEEINEAA